MAGSLALASTAALISVSTLPARGRGVEVIPIEAERRVDVRVGGEAFTSYIWGGTLKKPVLYPIRAASGAAVTRGFPLEARPGEREDHPHHVGLWFNYGDVNGIDFWNNSDAVAPDRRARMGTVVHREVLGVASGPDRGRLETRADWVMPDGSLAVEQRTIWTFGAAAETRTIDLVAVLQAQAAHLAFTDNKEGLLGLRVARGLEEQSGGEYLTSEGVRGAAVWGTRGRWCRLAGIVEGQPVTLAILDHPGNPGFPTHWHARGYGLFAANPLGQKELSGGKHVLGFSLPPSATATFRYRVLVYTGRPPAAQLDAAWKRWAAEG